MNPGEYCREQNGILIEIGEGRATYLQYGQAEVTVEQAEALKAYRWNIVGDVKDGRVIVERRPRRRSDD